jgi:acyl-CoA synthetase (AMP-forming)/AMP-acid ligase II
LNSLSLSDVFVGLANRWPDRRAIISQNLTLSFGQLAARAAQSAQELRSRGIGANANIGIAIRDNAETLVLMLAIWMLGSTAVPIDFRTRGRDLLAKQFGLIGIIEDRQSSAGGYHSILVDAAWSDIVARHDPTLVRRAEQRKPAPAFITLTSGTTAQPLGVVVDHERALCRFIFDLSQRFGAILLNPLSLSFSASCNHTFSALLQGSAVWFHPVLFSPGELANAVVTTKATSLCAVPTILRSLFELFGEPRAPAFNNLEALYCFGAPMSAEEKLRTKAVLCKNPIQEYGSSITGRISALSGSDLDLHPASVGRVLPFVTLEIVDADDRVLGSGEVGAIRVRSPAMATATYGDGASEYGDKLKGGWAYPGDLGVIDQGFLTLVGRSSDLIIRGGVNVYPSEVESVNADHEGVADVAVVGFTKQPEGEEIAAFVVPTTDLTEAALIAHCRVHLSSDKRPRKFVFVPSLPRNANGKIVRAELRDRLENESSAGATRGISLEPS